MTQENAANPARAAPARSDPADAVALSEAEQVVEAINEAIALDDAGPHDKAAHLLRRLADMLGGEADVELIVYADATVRPGPRIIERVVVGPTFDRIEPRPHSDVQALVDECQPILRVVVPEALSNPRTPRTLLIGRDIPDRQWFARIRDNFLARYGWVDFALGTWAASRDRLVMLAVPQRADQPAWGAEAERLVSLVLRAVAPIVDREMFQSLESDPAAPTAPAAPLGAPGAILADKDLSGRQTDVLHLLLRGMSEKEVARELGVSTHTVHTHVKRLYTEFKVSSRGELLALFVDKRVLRMTG